MKINKSFKQNLIFAAVILALAAALLAFRSWNTARKTPEGDKDGPAVHAQLTYGDDNTVMDISLAEDGKYEVNTGYYLIHLEVKDGAIRFVDSPCPDHICENYGFISLVDQQAVCLPAKAVVMIVPNH